MCKPLPKCRERTNRDTAMDLAGFVPGECYCGVPLLAGGRVACETCLALANRSLAGDIGATAALRIRCGRGDPIEVAFAARQVTWRAA